MTNPDISAELAACIEIERRIDATFLKAYEERMERRQGVCLSGFDPDPVTPRSEERIMEAALERLENMKDGLERANRIKIAFVRFMKNSGLGSTPAVMDRLYSLRADEWLSMGFAVSLAYARKQKDPA
jgi:hypothetical protein